MTRPIQVNTGIFISVMPGARMLSTVTIRLIAPVSEAMPVMQQADVPEVDAVARREDDAAVRGVVEPAAVGAAAEQPRSS